jgi:hypothetical protein
MLFQFPLGARQSVQLLIAPAGLLLHNCINPAAKRRDTRAGTLLLLCKCGAIATVVCYTC